MLYELEGQRKFKAPKLACMTLICLNHSFLHGWLNLMKNRLFLLRTFPNFLFLTSEPNT